MLSSTISHAPSKAEEDPSQSLNSSTMKKTQKDASNWSYELMAEDTYTNKIYQTLNFK